MSGRGIHWWPRVRLTDPEDLTDYISALPNDVLVSITSLLSIKEVGATSILSKKWLSMSLWKFTSRLVFDNRDRFLIRKPELPQQRSKFIFWVNNVMKNYRGEKLEQFCIRFCFDDESRGDIDRWLIFAAVMKVETLELDFWPAHHPPYVFPLIRLPLSNVFDQLLNLTLKWIKLREEALELVLALCVHLESMSLYYLVEVGNFKFSGSTLLLKHLTIVGCTGVTNIEISHINLISFCYNGGDLSKLTIRGVPKLEKVCTNGSLENRFFDMLSQCPCVSSLEVDMRSVSDLHITRFVLPELAGLKQLSLSIVSDENASLLGFISLIESCPNLRAFIMQVYWFNPSRRKNKEEQDASNHIHRHLELVIFKGYYGRPTDEKFVTYCLEKAINLKKIVIDCRVQGTAYTFGDDDIRVANVARRYAKKQLQSKKPLCVKLLII